MKNPNFLILDEPTNDLDLATLNILEEFLENFSGCLILVSHDRYFMDRLVDHLFLFESRGKIRDFNGNYTDYRESLKEEKQALKNAAAQPAAPAAKAVPVAAVSAPSRKLSFNEKRELDQLTIDISSIQRQIEQLENKLAAGKGNHADFAHWGAEIAGLKANLDQKELRWLELSE